MMEKIWISLIGEGGRLFMAPNGAHSMRAWVESINQNFHRNKYSNTTVVEWFGNNGNFVLNSSITNVGEITEFFCSCTGYNAVLLNLSHIYWLIQEICSISDLEHKKASIWDRDYGFLHGNAKKMLFLVQLILHVVIKGIELRPRPVFKCPCCNSPMVILGFRKTAEKPG